MKKIELSEEIKGLINAILDDDLQRKLVFLIESGRNHEEVLEELLKDVMNEYKNKSGGIE